MTDDIGLAAAAAARRHLMSSGHRAALRQDYTAAVGLLERAAALVPPDELDLALEIELGEALPWTGRADDAVRRAEAFAERAAASGDRVGELCGGVQAAVFRIYVEPEGAAETLATLVECALPVFQAAGDDMALYIAYSALAEVAFMRGQMGAQMEAYERAFCHAQRAGHVPPGSGCVSRWWSFFGRDSRVRTARLAR